MQLLVKFPGVMCPGDAYFEFAGDTGKPVWCIASLW